MRTVGSIRLAEVTYAIAREAARIRAGTGLTMPDAIAIATAIEHDAAVIATNDRQWPAAVAAVADGLRVVHLGSFVSDDP